ncbi:MAG: hypothetical protein ACON5J_00530, partial [Rubripirellula sp.]
MNVNSNSLQRSFFFSVMILLTTWWFMTVQPPLLAEVLRSAPTLESQLLSTPPLEIARIARER